MKAVTVHMIPSIPDPALAADEASHDALAAMNRPCDSQEDHAQASEYAQEVGLETYGRLSNLRQSAANMATVMLWHLLEQQMLMFHMRQVLKIHEEQKVRSDPRERKKLLTLEEFHRRLEQGGCSMKNLPAWRKVDELRLVANSVKHGQGKSLDDLYALRPDLLTMPGADDFPTFGAPRPAYVERPAGGQDLYVKDSDLKAYFEASIDLWAEFSRAIEAHSKKELPTDKPGIGNEPTL